MGGCAGPFLTWYSGLSPWPAFSTANPARRMAATARGLKAVASVPPEYVRTPSIPKYSAAVRAHNCDMWLRRELCVHMKLRRASCPDSTCARTYPAIFRNAFLRSSGIRSNSARDVSM